MMRGRSEQFQRRESSFLGERILQLALVLLASAMEAAEPPTWSVPRLEGEVRADGFLDERQYAQALHWDGFVEIQPRENAQPGRRTEVFVFSNEKGLVVGIRAHDPQPGEIKRERYRRDEAWNSERVEILLDPTGEAKQGLFIIVTPTNDVMDGLYDLSSGSTQLGYDLIFHHGARISEAGWECELVIPFSSLSFAPQTQARFLMLVQRYVPRKDMEVHSWLPIRRDSEDPREGMAYLLVDTAGVRAARSWHLLPAWVGSHVSEQHAARSRSAQGALGLTAEWQPRQDTLVKGTFRPDFSQVEADDTYQKINNRYPVYIREKRPFFLEGAESFATPFTLFYTRKIVQPEWGLKLSHRGEKLGLFAIVAQEENVPAARFGLSGPDKTTTWGVLRSTWSLDEAGSFLGATATYRDFGGDHRNSVFSIDAAKNGKKFSLVAQLAVSSTDGQDTAQRGSAATLEARYRWNEFWSTGASYERLSPSFQADAGFVVRTDREILQVQQSYSYKPKERVGLVRESNINLSWRNERTTSGQLVWQGPWIFGNVIFPRQLSFGASLGYGTEGVNGLKFPNTYVGNLWASWDEYPVLQPSFWVLVGRQVVYGPQAWQGGSQGWGGSFSSRKRAFTASLGYDEYSFGDGARTQKSWQAAVTYVWNEQWSAKLFLVDDDLRFFDYALAFRSRFINALLTYRVNPFSAVYVGANLALEREGELPRPLWDRTERQQVFLKISWYF